MKAIITVGIPASGKTTKYAEFYGYIVNRDDMREHLFGNYYSGGYKFTNAKEKQVTEHCWDRVLTCAAHKMDIVISDTNLNKGRRESLIEELEKLGSEVNKLKMIAFTDQTKVVSLLDEHVNRQRLHSVVRSKRN